MLTVETITSDRQFDSMSEEWSELLRDSNCDRIFLTWEWLHTWWRHLARRRRLFLLAVRDGGELVALAPFVQRAPDLGRLLLSRSLEFLGVGLIGSDYLDIIVRRGRERTAVEQLAAWLSSNRMVLSLTQVGPSSIAFELAECLANGNWRTASARTSVCPFIDLSGRSWDSYLQSLSSGHRYNFRRQLRQLGSRFDLKFETVAAEEDRERALSHLWQLHNRRWEDRGGSDGLTGRDVLAFHREFTRLALQRGWLRLSVLSLDGNPAAALYGFMHGGKFSYYQAGFDPAYARFSIGVVTLGLVIRNAIEEGAIEFDMLHGDERYKFHWTDVSRDLARIEMYPPDGLGLLCRGGVNLSRATRRMARTLLHGGIRVRMAAPVSVQPGKEGFVARTD